MLTDANDVNRDRIAAPAATPNAFDHDTFNTLNAGPTVRIANSDWQNVFNNRSRVDAQNVDVNMESPHANLD
jgi:hypothetical protein